MGKCTPTERAVRELCEAHAERARGYPFGPCEAARHEQKAQELLALDHPPEVGAGGEVIPESEPGMGHQRAIIRETLTQGATRIAEDASIARAELLLGPAAGSLAMAIDAAEAIDAANSLEKMLAHQMAVAHESALRLMNDAMFRIERHDSVEAARLANTAARLMSVYQGGLLTLQRLRTGGAQTVTVQHVNVQAGGQAVVGNVSTGGRKRKGAG